MSTFFVGYYMKRFVVYKVNSNNIHVIILTVRFTLHLHYEYLCTQFIKNTVYLKIIVFQKMRQIVKENLSKHLDSTLEKKYC